jgi:hypothetical protein
MDFGIIYQLRTKKFWWIDTIFYFVVALLLATIICYLIFTTKISFQEKRLKDLENSMANVGTAQQKELESKVLDYQKKIDNFAILLQNHKIPTNIPDFLEKTTLPNVWFYTFLITAKISGIQLSGEAENMPTLSRQISIFEGNELVKTISDLSSEITSSGRVRFSVNLSFDPNIFLLPSLEGMAPSGEILETTSPSTSLLLSGLIF